MPVLDGTVAALVLVPPLDFDAGGFVTAVDGGRTAVGGGAFGTAVAAWTFGAATLGIGVAVASRGAD